jgi:hypothetical protein
MPRTRHWVPLVELLALLSLFPATSRAEVKQSTTPTHTQGTGPAVLTAAELEKLAEIEPWTLASILVLTEPGMLAEPSASAASLVDAPVRNLVTPLPAGPPFRFFGRKEHVTTIVPGPAGMTEQEIRKAQSTGKAGK